MPESPTAWADPDRLISAALGGLMPLAVAMAMVALRDSMRSANVALVLVAVVVLVAVPGGREAGATAAVMSALAFDFFFTQPYLHLRIATSADVETTVLLLAVGLVVGHVSAKGRTARTAAEARRGEVRRIYRIAELAARGDEPSDVIMAAQAELTELLHLSECRFEGPPFGSSFERIERSGLVPQHDLRPSAGPLELGTGGFELPVLGRGQLLGRFVLHAPAQTVVSLEQRVVAVAIADQVGAALAAPRSKKENHRG